jgi:glycerophosphoryl diester phosphodiesterase
MSSFFPNQEALTILYRKGTQDDPFVSVEENIKVTNNRVFLKEIPDDYTKVTVETLQGVPLYETLEKSPSVNNYYVDYRLGICVFNEGQDGQSLNFTYLGKGMTFVNSSRIFIEGSESDPVKTLQDIVDESTTQISDAAQTIVDTETARQNAITATTNAQVQGDYAKSVADTNKNQWKLPVANFAAIATTYPTPLLGDRVITLDTNKEYRYQNGLWEYIAGNSTTAIGDAQNKIGDLSGLQTTSKTSLVSALNENLTKINSNTAQVAETANYLSRKIAPQIKPLELIAHRGFSSEGAENTMAAFTQAHQMGAYALECDVQFTSDGVAVLCHDGTIDRTTTGTGSIASMTLSQIQSYDAGSKSMGANFSGVKVPTFDEFLSFSKGRTHYILSEFKSYRTLSDLGIMVGLIQQYDMEKMCILQSFDFTHLDLLRGYSSVINFGALFDVEPTTAQYDKMESDGNCTLLINYDKVIANSSIVTTCYSRGIDIGVWTVDDRTTILKLLGMGVSKIMSNRYIGGIVK